MAKITWKSKEDSDRELQEQETARLESDRKKAEIESTPEKVATLEEENMAIMLASAETYEQMYSENMNLMLAIAEMYEMIMGGM